MGRRTYGAPSMAAWRKHVARAKLAHTSRCSTDSALNVTKSGVNFHEVAMCVYEWMVEHVSLAYVLVLAMVSKSVRAVSN